MMDSVFCVTNRVVALAAKGVYFRSIIKKRWYFTKSVPGLYHRLECFGKGGGECIHVGG